LISIVMPLVLTALQSDEDAVREAFAYFESAIEPGAMYTVDAIFSP
jgi:hypothetical protein